MEQQRNRGAYWALLILGVFMLMMGLAWSGGSLDAKRLSGTSLPNIFDSFFTPIILYLLPCIFISRALRQLNSRFQLKTTAVIGIALFGFITSFVGEAMKTNNYFVQADETINQALSNIEIAYEKRFNVIKNMDAASRRYQKHERETIQGIADARRAVVNAGAAQEKVPAIDRFDTSVRTLFVNIENYPNLKADQLVKELMNNISATEEGLLKEKTEYNNRVTEYNKSLRMMPYGLFGRLYGFKPKDLIRKENNADIYDARKLLARS